MAKDDPVRRAVELAQAGKKDRARAILKEILEQDIDNVSAWVAMAQLSETRTQAIVCLKQVLRLRPGNRWAQTHMERLTKGTSQRTPSPPPPTPTPSPEPELEPETPAVPSFAPTEGPVEVPDWLGDLGPGSPLPGVSATDPTMASQPTAQGRDMLSIDPLAGISADVAQPETKPRKLPRRIFFLVGAIVLLLIVCLGLFFIGRTFASKLPIIGPLLDGVSSGDTAPGGSPLPAEADPVIIEGEQCPLRTSSQYASAMQEVQVNLTLSEQMLRGTIASEDTAMLSEARGYIEAAQGRFAELTPTPCMQMAHDHGQRAMDAYSQALEAAENGDFAAATEALDLGADAMQAAGDEISRVMVELEEAVTP